MYNLEINDSVSKNRLPVFNVGFVSAYEIIKALENQEQILSLKEKMTSKQFLGAF